LEITEIKQKTNHSVTRESVSESRVIVTDICCLNC